MEIVILMASAAAFLILTAKKRKLIEFAQMRVPRKSAKLLSCDFCLSFWLNVILSIVLFFITKDATILLYCFVATPITRFLL